MRYRHASQRYFDAAQLDQRLRHGLIGHWIGGGSGLAWFDRSGYGGHGAVTNGPAWTLGEGGHRYGLEFDGTDDYVDVGDKNDLIGAFTVAVWANWKDTASHKSLVTKGTGAGTGEGYRLLIDPSNRIYAHIANGVNEALVNPATALSAASWHHIAIVKVAATIYAYGDGALLGSAAASFNVNDSTYSLNFGREAAGNQFYLPGRLDDIRIYNRALTDSEIALLANPAFLPILPSGRRYVNTTLVPAATPWVPQMALMGIG